jgi:hypothetical protein
VRKFHDVAQNEAEWEALRIGKATASQFGTFMANFGKDFGDPAKRYALQIALERLTGKRAEHGFSNEHTERGHDQEPVARMLYAEEHFCDVGNGGFFDCGQYGDSPDGLVGDDGVIEIKSVLAPTHFATIQRGSYDPAYKWQLVGHLDCTGRRWVDFVSYCSDFPEESRLCVYRLHREECEDELRMLNERRADFLLLVVKTMNQINLRQPA